MTTTPGHAHLTAQAYVMEQLVDYVTAVGDMHAVPGDTGITYEYHDRCVLVAYPPAYDPLLWQASSAEERTAALHAAVQEGLAHTHASNVTVLAPERPRVAPPEASVRSDAYLFLSLPWHVPDGKLRNMLRRAQRECRIAVESFAPEHEHLLEEFCRHHALDTATRSIYARIGRYLASCPDAMLFAARAPGDHRLLALTVGDYTSLTTASYMFAARAPFCPPGVADALLLALLREAERRGHSQINLGLGIHEGIRRFKQKWGTLHALPYVETSWKRTPPVPQATRRTAPALSHSELDGALSVYRTSTWAKRLRHAIFGEQRPFDCLQVEVTSYCSGHCLYCPHTTRRTTWRSRHMSAETFAALHPLVSRARRVHLQGWGEPLRNPLFFSFATAAHRVGCAVSTTTCGLGMDTATAQKLVDGTLDIVAFSLTGVDAQSNAVREGIPFAKVVAGIARLREAKRQAKSALPHIHLAYLMLASQGERVAELPALMHGLGISVTVISTLDYIAAPEWAHEAFCPGDARSGQALTVLRRAAAQAAADGRHILYGLPGKTPLKECAEGIQSSLYVDAEGTLSPCVYCNPPTTEADPDRHVFGDVTHTPPLELWKAPAFRRFREAQASGTPGPLCAACPKRFERLQ